jgi:NADPH:quinone reductase-like Zn-dependent oxidoreductase
MKAIRMHAFGGPETLKLDDVPMPQPRDDEIVVKVHAASVNPIDARMRWGMSGTKQAQLPAVPGRDVSGTVEACGPQANGVRRGDAVIAMLARDRGGYAEYVVVRAGECAAKPESLGHAQAAAVPLAALTAWQGLFDHGQLKAGQRVLIHGGAGGVGHFAIQFAKARGATVVTTVSTRDVEFARKLGADEVIDYTKQRFEDETGEVDLVFDLVAGETQERSWDVLRRGGCMVSTLAQPSRRMASQAGVRGVAYMSQPNAAQLARIGELIDEGKVRPRVHATYPLARAAVAQHTLETTHTRGKIVLEVAT